MGESNNRSRVTIQAAALSEDGTLLAAGGWSTEAEMGPFAEDLSRILLRGRAEEGISSVRVDMQATIVRI